MATTTARPAIHLASNQMKSNRSRRMSRLRARSTSAASPRENERKKPRDVPPFGGGGQGRLAAAGEAGDDEASRAKFAGRPEGYGGDDRHGHRPGGGPKTAADVA